MAAAAAAEAAEAEAAAAAVALLSSLHLFSLVVKRKPLSFVFLWKVNRDGSLLRLFCSFLAGQQNRARK